MLIVHELADAKASARVSPRSFRKKRSMADAVRVLGALGRCPIRTLENFFLPSDADVNARRDCWCMLAYQRSGSTCFGINVLP
jgi:hypothetical protein